MKRWGYVITGILGGMLAAMVLRDSTPSQIGGGDVCPCVTPIVITATQQMVISPTPLATPTDGSVQPSASPTPLVRNTPTIVPPGMTHTPLPCRFDGASEYGKLFVYVFTDKQQRGLAYQNIRNGPGTQYAVIGRLWKSEAKRNPVYWRYNGWDGINETCSAWVLNLMGEEYPAGTE